MAKQKGLVFPQQNMPAGEEAQAVLAKVQSMADFLAGFC